jgi:hypothetical protein
MPLPTQEGCPSDLAPAYLRGAHWPQPDPPAGVRPPWRLSSTSHATTPIGIATPRARTRTARAGERQAHRGDERTSNRERRARIRAHAPGTSRTRDDTLDDSPSRPRYRLALHHLHHPHALPARSLTALPSPTPCSSSSPPILLARRPASGPTATCQGCPANSIGRSRKGGPARSGGPPFLESPGLEPNPGRRRGGGPFAS